MVPSSDTMISMRLMVMKVKVDGRIEDAVEGQSAETRTVREPSLNGVGGSGERQGVALERDEVGGEPSLDGQPEGGAQRIRRGTVQQHQNLATAKGRE